MTALHSPPLAADREEIMAAENRAARERLALLEAELLQLRRWACDASVALQGSRANIGRARTNVNRIYHRILKLTGTWNG